MTWVPAPLIVTATVAVPFWMTPRKVEIEPESGASVSVEVPLAAVLVTLPLRPGADRRRVAVEIQDRAAAAERHG